MLISRLTDELQSGPSDAREFVVYLATVDLQPDDDIDVQLVEIGDVVVDYEQQQIRLIPASSTAVKPDPGTFTLLGSVLDACPADPDGDADLRLVIELPLLREDPRFDRPELSEVAGLHLGSASQEAWFLVHPAQRFPSGSLPA